MKGNNNTEINYDYKNLTGALKFTLTNDYMFKAFLQRNEKALRGLICALLSLKDQDIRSICITNPIEQGTTITDKTIIMDIRLILNNKQIINIEMQVDNLGDWPERSLTYVCKNYDHLKQGQDYSQVMKVVHIGILDFTPEGFPEKLYLEYYFANKNTSHIYSDKISIHVLQLNQLGNADDEANMPELYYWAQLFRATTWEEIIMLAEKNDSIREGIVTLKELSEDEKIQLECEARERYRRDLASATSYGEKQGRAEGIELGRTEGIKLGRSEERTASISILVTTLKELNHTEEQIIEQLTKKYNLSSDEAKKYMCDCA